MARGSELDEGLSAPWSRPTDEVLSALGTSAKGLTAEEAARRLDARRSGDVRAGRRGSSLGLLLSQFKSPITLLLLGAAVLSLFLRDRTDALIVMGIVLASAMLGFWQERGSAHALDKLLSLVASTTTVLRGGREKRVHLDEVVAGDIVVLRAGSTVPADCVLIEALDLFLNEASLTGETYPVEKSPGVVPAEARTGQRTNSLFEGTYVVSGRARAVAVRTGGDTEFGKISRRLRLRPPETDFEHGVRRFGYFLMQVTFVLILAIFAANVLLHRPVLDAFLFSLALAVGLTPQLLPAIISVNLAHGARRMATRKVIVRRLASIENFGSMDVLCSDKTGTLTRGVVEVHAGLDAQGDSSRRVLELAFVNASFESGFLNPIDEAIRHSESFDISGYEKLDEIPYDFTRKRLSILVRHAGAVLLVSKGAVKNILEVCTRVEFGPDAIVDLDGMRTEIESRYESLSADGFRVLAMAYRDAGDRQTVSRKDETDMVFAGFVVLRDPVKPDITKTIGRLKGLGVGLKIITGDNRFVAASVAKEVGLSSHAIVVGDDLRNMSDDALLHLVGDSDVFAEIEPAQKERIVLALKRAGRVVGYMGDGINDVTALHSADVGISVDQAVDVAKETADIVLLKRDLNVLVDGVEDGRATFANTLKYVFMATSANFGNMFTMAGASLFLPFLPLLPKQILLTNLLTDFPEMTIARDGVDPELVARPRRWDVGFIRRFMLMFGPLSSVFDFLTFVVLFVLPNLSTAQIRTGWFMESVVSACMVVLVVRTRQRFWKSRPATALIGTTIVVAVVALLIPVTPVAGAMGFAPLPAMYPLILLGIVVLYMGSAELAKTRFYRGSRLT